MKLNKQILEAVRRGIQLALDDYEDIETSNSISHNNDIIDSDDVIQTEIDFWNQWVDLGLPSGTLWAKSNIGADCDNYAESWYGDYFAWGEIEPKEKYSWETYKFGEERQLTKYCYDKQYSANYIIPRTDDLKELQSKDDIATILFGNHVHIPTKEQIQELLIYTTNEEQTDYNGIKGLNGILFIGKNGNELFIPFGGWYEYNIKLDGYRCYIWTSNISNKIPSVAYALYASENDINCYSLGRCNGVNIRPVYNK